MASGDLNCAICGLAHRQNECPERGGKSVAELLASNAAVAAQKLVQSGAAPKRAKGQYTGAKKAKAAALEPADEAKRGRGRPAGTTKEVMDARRKIEGEQPKDPVLVKAVVKSTAPRVSKGGASGPTHFTPGEVPMLCGVELRDGDVKMWREAMRNLQCLRTKYGINTGALCLQVQKTIGRRKWHGCEDCQVKKKTHGIPGNKEGQGVRRWCFQCVKSHTEVSRRRRPIASLRPLAATRLLRARV